MQEFLVKSLLIKGMSFIGSFSPYFYLIVSCIKESVLTADLVGIQNTPGSGNSCLYYNSDVLVCFHLF